MINFLNRMNNGDVVIIFAGKMTEKVKGMILLLLKRNKSVTVYKATRRKRHIKIKEAYKVLIRCSIVCLLSTEKAEIVVLYL
ncbi:MAG: hypothetical protein A2452_07365 [Candidatus Firestonebacteria bacterium RIFOXYC2_FULL_39_67]|nr:MAG: hypothetical protein A2452_07365 [Candidatus Firestonebacteria bacterium RIFOXYC2_FULL_39_67]